MTIQSPQIFKMTAITVGRSDTVSYFDRPGSGPTILYIHGLGCSKADFIDMSFVPELKPSRLISADNPGCGDSSYGNLAPEDCMFSRKVMPHSYSHFESIVFP